MRHRNGVLVFEFVGKSGIEHRIEIGDPLAIDAVEVMRRRGGGSERLPAYKRARRWVDLDAASVNDYPAIVESSYVDPRVLDLYEGGVTIEAAVRRRYRDPATRQAGLERAVLRMLSGAPGPSGSRR